jgi:aminopeptidase N
MRPAFAGDIAASASRPRYNLQLQIDPNTRRLTGSERILFINATGEALGDIALRLYPNFPRDVFGRGGDVRMDITNTAINGQPIMAHYAAAGTAAILPLERPLAPGAALTIDITFTATIRPASDGSFQLPSYYPMLAVHEPSGWRMDVTTFADHVYAESALYSASVTVPAGLSVVATGTTIATHAGTAGNIVYDIVSGPVREWALTIGNFAVAHDRVDDIAINVYTTHGSKLDAQQIAHVAALALATYQQRFGAYPYRELDIQLYPGRFDGGDEYPGLILLTSAGAVSIGTRYVTAHEVAHQWWYSVVGNDIYHEPWLDEAYAQYSAIIYDEDKAGAQVARADWEREVVARVARARVAGDLPVRQTIDAFPSFSVYYNTVYGKGSVFLRSLREQIGDTAFFAGLQRYYHDHRYAVATTADLQQAFEQASGRDLGALFAK